MISKKAIELIIKHEVGGRSVYEKRYQKPIWAGGDSGVTIGLGYDCGYVTEKQFFSDWDGLNLNFIHALRKVVGIKGEAVKTMLRGEILQVRIPYNFAYDVFVNKSLPKVVFGASKEYSKAFPVRFNFKVPDLVLAKTMLASWLNNATTSEKSEFLTELIIVKVLIKYNF